MHTDEKTSPTLMSPFPGTGREKRWRGVDWCLILGGRRREREREREGGFSDLVQEPGIDGYLDRWMDR